MRVLAALMTAPHEPLVVDEVELAPPRRDEVLRARARLGHLPLGPLLPGRQVADPVPGRAGPRGRRHDRGGRGGRRSGARRRARRAHVRAELRPLPLLPRGPREPLLRGGRLHGRRRAARRHDAADAGAGRTAYHLAFVSSFATHAVVPGQRGDPDRGRGARPSSRACSAAASRRACCRSRAGRTCGPGDAVAIFACGGVGLSAVQGARLVSAHPVIAVDPLPHKRELALALGATHAIDPALGDAVAADPRARAGRRRPRVRGDRQPRRRRAGVRVGARRRHDDADRPARDRRAGVVPGLRRDAVRAHDPGLEPGRREPRAPRPARSPGSPPPGGSTSPRW